MSAELPPISKFLPPPPDTILGGAARIIGEFAKIPIEAVKAIGGVVTAAGAPIEAAINEFESLPERE